MADKQLGKKHEMPDKAKHQEGNFGQKQAREARDKEDELAHMGEMTREAASKGSQKGH
jgi:hypothetical protein